MQDPSNNLPRFLFFMILPTALHRLLCFAALFLTAASAQAAFAPDQNFRPPAFTASNPPVRALLLPDEKYLLYYLVDTLTDRRASALTRYLPNGTLDTSFNFSPDYQSVSAAVAAPDGKLYVAAQKTLYNKEQTSEVLRLNSDGSIDPSFGPTVVGTDSIIFQIRLQADGKILVAGLFNKVAGEDRSGLVRLLSDGTVDPGFAAINISDGFLYSAAVQPDGKILVGGAFTFINGTFPPGIARLNPDGTLDSSFAASGFVRSNGSFGIRGIIVLGDGKILLCGRMRLNSSSGSNHFPLVRLNADGSRDPAFATTIISGLFAARDCKLQADGKILVALDRTVYRFQTDGPVDSSFSRPTLENRIRATVGSAYTVDLFSDGDILMGGSFTDIIGSTLPPEGSFGATRLNPDGTVDPSLTTSHRTGNHVSPTLFSRRSDGSTLIAFGHQQNEIHPRMPYDLGRLLPDGSLDSAFRLTPASPSEFLSETFRVFGFESLNDGGSFVFGSDDNFTQKYGKVSASGMEVSSSVFAPGSAFFQKAKALPDGKILLSAGTDLISIATASLTRLRADGQPDGSFHFPQSIRDRQVMREAGTNTLYAAAAGNRVLAVQPDGKMLLEYLTNFYDGSAGNSYLVRLNADGSIDPSFSEIAIPHPDATVTYELISDPLTQSSIQVETTRTDSLLLDAQIQPDGRIVLAGPFKSFAGVAARGLVRLMPNGEVDTTFHIGGGAQWTNTTETDNFFPSVEHVLRSSDGTLLVTGTFEAFNGTPAPGIALLNADGSVVTSFSPPVVRDKFASAETALARQADGSILLSGPYRLLGESSTPSFIRLVSTTPVISSLLTASAVQGQPFSYQVTANPEATSFAATGLPAGLSINQTTGLISGTPSAAGTYNVTLSATNATGTGTAILTLTITPAGIGNISTRVSVGRGDDVLIGGFIISGNTPKKVIIRAIASSLTANGAPVPGRLLDPVLELRNTNGVLSTNDDWRATQEQEIIESTIPPLDDRESAIVANLTPGAYTAVMRGKDNQTGIGLVEVYDLGNPGAAAGSSAGLVNISTRGSVLTGDDVMIGGFIIVGAPTDVIVRAIGPDLTARGVAGAVQDTTMELFDANGMVGSNDDWRSTQEQEIINTTVPPNDNRESAIVARLAPGGYTAIVRGKNGTTGVALVEVFYLR